MLKDNFTPTGSADLNVAGSKHTGVIEIFFDADKDNNKKLHIVTDTDITSSSIASKSVKFLENLNLYVPILEPQSFQIFYRFLGTSSNFRTKNFKSISRVNVMVKLQMEEQPENLK